MVAIRKQRPYFRVQVFIIFSILLAKGLSSAPPIYKTISREQNASYAPKNEDLVRIWIVFVDQGDGILVQLPSKYNYSFGQNGRPEQVDVVVDGGSFDESNEKLMLHFLHAIYPQSPITIEHVVLSHHDSDHVKGLTKILLDPSIAVQHVYHNGLASYRPQGEILNDIQNSNGAILDKKKNKITKIMAPLDRDGKTLRSQYIIGNLGQLRSGYDQNVFIDLYNDFAQAVTQKTEPHAVLDFFRAWERRGFVDEAEASEHKALPDVSFALIWPLEKLSPYKKEWGYTINGNSVTFKLKYRDFEMLFPGDQNELSEDALIQHLISIGKINELNCDVLKAPHHGSKHNLGAFFNAVQPVLTVASMGRQGIFTNWKHPSSEVIQWAGGAHRFYSTYLHERVFSWEKMKSREYKNGMIEKTHIMIETDGNWFRLVELDASETDLNRIPPVEQTRRGNGTCWIKAK